MRDFDCSRVSSTPFSSAPVRYNGGKPATPSTLGTLHSGPRQCISVSDTLLHSSQGTRHGVSGLTRGHTYFISRSVSSCPGGQYPKGQRLSNGERCCIAAIFVLGRVRLASYKPYKYNGVDVLVLVAFHYCSSTSGHRLQLPGTRSAFHNPRSPSGGPWQRLAIAAIHFFPIATLVLMRSRRDIRARRRRPISRGQSDIPDSPKGAAPSVTLPSAVATIRRISRSDHRIHDAPPPTSPADSFSPPSSSALRPPSASFDTRRLSTAQSKTP